MKQNERKEQKNPNSEFELLGLLSDIALLLGNIGDFDRDMDTVLSTVGKQLQVSRAYIFLDDKDGTITNNVFEWCNNGIIPQIDYLQNVPYEIIPSWKQILHNEGKVYSENISDLPQDILKLLGPQGILSIVVYPLYIDHRISGFIGFDECKFIRKWSKSELEVLRTISGIISNAYERKYILEKIEASENNFRTFFNTINDLFFVADNDGKILHANNAVIEKLGYSQDELKEMNILNLHPKEKRVEASAILSEMFKGERDYCPLQIERKDHRKIPVETRVWFGKWNGNESIFGISKDLSKEQEALQKFTKIFENNPCLLTISRYSDDKILDVNTSFINTLGYSRDEIIGKTSKELNLFIEPNKQRQVAEVLIKNGSINDMELDIRCKNGKIIHVLFSGEIINNQGKKSFLTVLVDITERIKLNKRVQEHTRDLEALVDKRTDEYKIAYESLRETQSQLIQSEKLAGVGQLAAGVAHEINTPIQYVGDNVRFCNGAFDDFSKLLISFEKLIRETFAGEISSEIIKKMDKAKINADFDYLIREIPVAIQQSLEGIEHISSIVAAMKEFSHPGSGVKTLINIKRAIESTIIVARNEWKYVADMQTEYEEKLPDIFCYPGDINQVILNIITNAAHAIGEVMSENISLKGIISIKTMKNENYIEIRISDNGSGIPEEIRSRIFEPFFTTKEIGKGTGQGLAIVYNVIVERHDGSISVESEIGKGTTFVIQIPFDSRYNDDE